MTNSGYECIIESIKLFEAKLSLVVTDKTPVDDLQNCSLLAQKSGYSLWHFIRLFSCTTGITPKAYITSRIFTECAKLLVLQKSDKNYKSISFISSIFGFVSSANFSNAFKTWSGFTPAQIRKNAEISTLSSVLMEPLILSTEHKIEKSLDDELLAEIIVCPTRHITGLSFYLDKPLLSFDRLWKTFMAKVEKINAENKDDFIQYTAWNPSENGGNSDGQMLVVCALTTDEKTDQEPFFISKTIPGGRFLHVVHTGSMSEIGETYKKIYGMYFAESKLKLTSGWEYQMYRDDATDIFIPLF